MGRGNVSVSGPYEGLYYISNDHFHVYRRNKPFGDEAETRLMSDLSYDDLTGNDWTCDEWGTDEEEADILECFSNGFSKMFPSFKKPMQETWVKNGVWGPLSRRVILESKLFYIAVEDNEWSLAVELIQKEDPYDDHLSGLQGRHYMKYLEGMKTCLLKRLPSIGTYAGAWTSGIISREKVI